MRYAARRDVVERPIIEALEHAGAEVWVLDRPADLLIWHRQRWYVLEVKSPRGQLSRRQSEDRAEGRAQGIVLVRTPVDALKAIGVIR